MEKHVHVKLDRNSDFTLREVLKKMRRSRPSTPNWMFFSTATITPSAAGPGRRRKSNEKALLFDVIL